MRIRSLLFSATAALLASCNPFGACTLIGCYDGLQVGFSRPPSGAFRLEVTGSTDSVARVVECADVAGCPLMFEDFTPERVTVRLVDARGTFTQQFTPRYETLRPNGRGCGPSCRQAAVTVQLSD